MASSILTDVVNWFKRAEITLFGVFKIRKPKRISDDKSEQEPEDVSKRSSDQSNR